jgi:hypothetical protein
MDVLADVAGIAAGATVFGWTTPAGADDWFAANDKQPKTSATTITMEKRFM